MLDPRGYAPPFGLRHAYNPKPGQLVLFPSYMPHSVEPTIGTDPRISYAFNIPGEWYEIADVNIVMDGPKY